PGERGAQRDPLPSPDGPDLADDDPGRPGHAPRPIVDLVPGAHGGQHPDAAARRPRRGPHGHRRPCRGPGGWRHRRPTRLRRPDRADHEGRDRHHRRLGNEVGSSYSPDDSVLVRKARIWTATTVASCCNARSSRRSNSSYSSPPRKLITGTQSRVPSKYSTWDDPMDTVL